MSSESCIEELYGDSKNTEWKEQEVARLKAEQGVQNMDSSSMADDLEI